MTQSRKSYNYRHFQNLLMHLIRNGTLRHVIAITESKQQVNQFTIFLSLVVQTL